MKTISFPLKDEYPSYYGTYLGYVEKVTDILAFAEAQIAEVRSLFGSLTAVQADFAYAEGKWSAKQLLGHLIDTEKIMLYRAISFARGEQQSLAGFDENAYVANGGFEKRSIADLLEDFELGRRVYLKTISSFEDQTFKNLGKANNYPMSVQAIAYMIPGHVAHHMAVYQTRYLPVLPR